MSVRYGRSRLWHEHPEFTRRTDESWKARVLGGVLALVILHARLCEQPSRSHEAGDPLPRKFVPTDIERKELGEKLQFAVWKIVVYPPGHRSPRGALFFAVGKPWYDDGRHGADSAILAALVPDMPAPIRFVRGAVPIPLIAQAVDLG